MKHMEKLKKMMEAKMKGKGSAMSDLEKEAKMKAVSGLKDMAEDEMGDSVKSLKKVSVMSDSKKGLKAGLKKAEDMIGGEETEESGFNDEAEGEPKSEKEPSDDLRKKLAKLIASKKSK